MKKIATIALATAALASPSSALADSGSITNVQQMQPPGDTSLLVATYTATSTTCDADGYCGWYMYAVQSPSTGCTPYVNGDGRLTMVGNDVHQYGETDSKTDSFKPEYDSGLLCLYISSVSTGDRLVATTAFTKPSQPRTAPTQPTASTPETQPVAVIKTPPPAQNATLSPAAAKRAASRALAGKFGKAWWYGSRRKLTATRYSSTVVEVAVSFRYHGLKYAGRVVVTLNDDGTTSSRVRVRAR